MPPRLGLLTARQFFITLLKLENETGTLARLCRDLADGGVNLLALSAPATKGKAGPIRLLVQNRELAETAVSRPGHEYTEEEVLFVELKNRPGALAKAEKLAKARVPVKYAYATAYTKAGKTAAVIAVEPERLGKALALRG
ncbi:MAG TPA: hypothetical protein VLK65_21640 [Vicinamibacteria bacterium]|nr:hypothetical protein [Vicinamibacteria bacterium]